MSMKLKLLSVYIFEVLLKMFFALFLILVISEFIVFLLYLQILVQQKLGQRISILEEAFKVKNPSENCLEEKILYYIKFIISSTPNKTNKGKLFLIEVGLKIPVPCIVLIFTCHRNISHLLCFAKQPKNRFGHPPMQMQHTLKLF